MTDLSEVLIDAATNAMQLGSKNDREYLELLKAGLGLCKTEVLRNLKPSDKVSLAVPGVFEFNGKTRTGMLTLTEDRAIAVWDEGVLRSKLHSAVAPLASITNVEYGPKKGARMTKVLSCLSFSSGGQRFDFYMLPEAMKDVLGQTLKGMLDGSMTPIFEVPPDPDAPAVSNESIEPN